MTTDAEITENDWGHKYDLLDTITSKGHERINDQIADLDVGEQILLHDMLCKLSAMVFGHWTNKRLEWTASESEG